MENSQENRLNGESAVCKNLATHYHLIQDFERKYDRHPGSVSLLAVSKTKPSQLISEALECGQVTFGENYAQELEEKASQTNPDDVQWHFIGPIQSNKTQIIAAHADWVHSLERMKIAQRLSKQRPVDLPPLQVCIQVNLDNETSKSGVAIQDLDALCDKISELQHLTVRGLMCIPKATTDFDKSRKSFAKLRHALEYLNNRGYDLDTLSMGMSNDFEAAIAEGATIIRIGTAIFGHRG